MAAACKKLFNSDLAAAVTGIAGPDGGTGEKPVGTVHIAFAIDNRVMSRLLTLRGDRALIRKQAAYNILRFIADKC
jgi:nicotinamide mononucleotide (NMN) deamidase PncC